MLCIICRPADLKALSHTKRPDWMATWQNIGAYFLIQFCDEETCQDVILNARLESADENSTALFSFYRAHIRLNIRVPWTSSGSWQLLAAVDALVRGTRDWLCGPRLLPDSMLFTEELQECPTIRPNGSCQRSCCAVTDPSGNQLSENRLCNSLLLCAPVQLWYQCHLLLPPGLKNTDSPPDVQFELHCVKYPFPAQWDTVGVRRPWLTVRRHDM